MDDVEAAGFDCAGWSAAEEIGAALFVEESTIRTHVKRILMTLDLRDRVQVVIHAYETGLLDAPKPTVQP